MSHRRTRSSEATGKWFLDTTHHPSYTAPLHSTVCPACRHWQGDTYGTEFASAPGDTSQPATYSVNCPPPHPPRTSPRHREATHRTHTPWHTVRPATSTSASLRLSFPPTSAKPHRSRRRPRSANMSAPALSTPGTTSPVSLSGVA